MEEKIYPSMVIRSQAEVIELLEKENQQLKKEIEYLKEKLENDIDRYEDTISYQLGFDIGKEKYKQKVDKAVNRISLLKMDNDTSEETHKAIDYILKALLD